MKRNPSVFLVAFLALAGIVLLYPEVIFGLNDFMFSIEGDGLKNYYNFMYHIRHDRSYLLFEGMNYPYGETLLMVDLHPALSTALKFVSNHVVDLSGHSVGILNGLMMASVVLSAVFLTLILDVLKVPRALAMVSGLAIACLSSQMLLWEFGHYALSYTCFFPITWYLIVKSMRSDRVLTYSFLIFLNSLIWFYTHTYLGLMAVGFHGGVLLLALVADTGSRKRVFAKIALQVALPLLIVYAILKITDQREGRLEMPFVSDYKATAQTVFFPNHSFTAPLYELIFDLSPRTGLSWSKVGTYVGLPVNIFLLGYLLYVLSQLYYRRWSSLAEPYSPGEWKMILSSVFLLFFSMAIPLVFVPDAWLPDALKQFIGLGRFGWPFFYVITVFCIVFLHRMLPQRLAVFAILFSSAIWIAEGIGNHRHLHAVISQHPNVLKDFEHGETMAALSRSINFEEYQAIVPLPFYHRYITPTQFKGSLKSETLSMGLSYSTGLPLMGAILSRPSVLESKSILQLFSPWHYEKTIQNDLNRRPLLLLYTKEGLTELEQNLLDQAEVVFAHDELVALRLPVAAIHEGKAHDVAEFAASMDQFHLDGKSGYYMRDSLPFVYESFDHMGSPLTKRGTGALTLDRKHLVPIYHSEGGVFDPGLEYTFSFWYYNYIYDQSYTGLAFHVQDSVGTPISTTYLRDPIKTPLYEGNWAYNAFDFKVTKSSDRIELTLSAIDIFADSLYVDELLIYPKGGKLFKPIYSPDGKLKAVWRNNERIPLR